MKKTMDPVWEAEKIIEAYVGGKSTPRREKKPKGKRTALLLTGGAGILLAAVMLFYL